MNWGLLFVVGLLSVLVRRRRWKSPRVVGGEGQFRDSLDSLWYPDRMKPENAADRVRQKLERLREKRGEPPRWVSELAALCREIGGRVLASRRQGWR